MFERTPTSKNANIQYLNEKVALGRENTGKYAEIVLTMDDIIRDILTIEFGPDFTQNKGTDQMVASIKKGLGVYLSGPIEAKEVVLH
ncbi:hypothetical protein ACFL57_02900 [Candidatus Margulisiibacteriota bacterium]